jgi:hypothetical protein
MCIQVQGGIGDESPSIHDCVAIIDLIAMGTLKENTQALSGLDKLKSNVEETKPRRKCKLTTPTKKTTQALEVNCIGVISGSFFMIKSTLLKWNNKISCMQLHCDYLWFFLFFLSMVYYLLS